ncbi:antibiotic biosynthesis monooxygenase family protein [Christiangramia sediminis]|uniref:Antibiotic biosynthesis monooxygenase n=1 Tax=Christiangramia sediminis TaxID=2881336 RepID=A0A9X1LK37_9FLAO|nr:antibiotic biosynthesis monooxygenase [Christiangramia sediminis]MCB7481707.1 antibiotic biosynthesis monooxygenase [Christiangramia sediminis]
MIATMPKPPYYAVIFTSLLKKDQEGYAEMAEKMEQLAKEQLGYLGFESARSEIGISISYWKDLASIQDWKNNSDHLLAQKLGKEKWYSSYHIRISKVERAYEFNTKENN